MVEKPKVKNEGLLRFKIKKQVKMKTEGKKQRFALALSLVLGSLLFRVNNGCTLQF